MDTGAKGCLITLETLESVGMSKYIDKHGGDSIRVATNEVKKCPGKIREVIVWVSPELAVRVDMNVV